LQLDDHLKNLLRELGHAINDTVSDSDRITGAIAGVRAHGYDIVLKLDATIGLANRRRGCGMKAAKLSKDGRLVLESQRNSGGSGILSWKRMTESRRRGWSHDARTCGFLSHCDCYARRMKNASRRVWTAVDAWPAAAFFFSCCRQVVADVVIRSADIRRCETARLLS